MDINIIQKTALANTTIKTKRKIDFIVLHYTAGVSSKKGNAQAIANYFSKSSSKASADFIVDDAEIVQYNGNIENRYCWAVGGSKYKTKSNSLAAKYYNVCKNANSISIEMCSNKKNTKSLNANDNDWYLTEATVNNAIQLTKYLMKKYNIAADHVITHNMVTGKLCPQPWVKNENALKDWKNFLSKLAGTAPTTPTQPKPKPKEEVKPVSAYKIRVNVAVLNIRAEASTSSAIKGTVKKGEVYTIVEEKNGFGKLKSGIGWISLHYTIKA